MIDKLIINADDFGLTQKVSQGIIDGYEKGIITSTTLLMNSPYVSMILNSPLKDSCGVHLNITIGQPLTSGKSFTINNRFKKRNEYEEDVLVDEEELYQEWHAQIEKFIELVGHLPTHIDSHHNIHILYPQVYERLSLEYDIPVRMLNGDVNDYEVVPCLHFRDLLCDLSYLKRVCEDRDGCLEIMTHPGYEDEELYSISSYGSGRETELKFWLDPQTKKFLKENHVQLINFKALKKAIK